MYAKPLCIYHHGCADGQFAAWTVRKAYGADHVDFHPGIYGEEPPEVIGRPVVMVDFSYKREAILKMSAQATSILIIDHHQTAEQELRDLPANVRCVFDMKRCGAMLAWNTFFIGQSSPLIFDYVQDRDLWTFELPSSREVTAAIYSHDLSFEGIDALIAGGIIPLINDGRALLRKQRKDIDAIVRDATRFVWFGSHKVPAANVPWMLASDVAGELAKGQPFAATYYDDATGRRWSLRSTKDGLDVAEIAQTYGGGGHKHAAGFRMTGEETIEFELACGVVR